MYLHQEEAHKNIGTQEKSTSYHDKVKVSSLKLIRIPVDISL